MKFTKEMVLDYADKLLIGLNEEEVNLVLEEFQIIDETISSVCDIPDISKVEPMTHALDDFTFVLRSDELEDGKDGYPTEVLLRNAEKVENDEIVVPKVVG